MFEKERTENRTHEKAGWRKIEIINTDNEGGCRNVFVFVMGGAALPDTDGSSGCQDQQEGSGTAAEAGPSVGRESGALGCLSGGSGCCESVAVVSRPLALRAGRGSPHWNAQL